MSLDDLRMFSDNEYKNMKGREELLTAEFLYRIAVAAEEHNKLMAEVNRSLKIIAKSHMIQDKRKPQGS